jgi:hypothetical protein
MEMKSAVQTNYGPSKSRMPSKQKGACESEGNFYLNVSKRLQASLLTSIGHRTYSPQPIRLKEEFISGPVTVIPIHVWEQREVVPAATTIAAVNPEHSQAKLRLTQSRTKRLAEELRHESEWCSPMGRLRKYTSALLGSSKAIQRSSQWPK